MSVKILQKLSALYQLHFLGKLEYTMHRLTHHILNVEQQIFNLIDPLQLGSDIGKLLFFSSSPECRCKYGWEIQQTDHLHTQFKSKNENGLI